MDFQLLHRFLTKFKITYFYNYLKKLADIIISKKDIFFNERTTYKQKSHSVLNGIFCCFRTKFSDQPDKSDKTPHRSSLNR